MGKGVGARHKKAPDVAGAFQLLETFEADQYFATTGPLQLKR
jgi:hypothetical protein